VPATVDLLDVHPDDTTAWATWSGGLWRTWYSALWVEAGVLAGSDDVADRRDVGGRAAEGNPIAECIVERAGAMADGEPRRLVELASDFERLGCVYQAARSRHLADRG
jgi:hypothetical protein